MSINNFRLYRINEKTIAELDSNDFIINDVQDALDLLAEAGSKGAGSLVVNSKNFAAKFFDLKTGLAGEVLQKFSNYRVRLAITGDFTVYKSKSLSDFIRECNRGNQIFFCDDINSALLKLE